MSTKLRPIKIVGKIAYIPLTKGYTAIIDSEDVALVEGRNWHACVLPHTTYAVRQDRIGGGKRRAILLHRLILMPAAGLQVDHISGDGLDNRRANLRIATPAQNQRNQRLSRANKSGFKGVCRSECGKKWRAYIRHDRKTHYLGTHATAEQAHQAYMEASSRLHGEFGRAK